MENVEIKKREYWIDIAKGIGIIFVMLGHTVIGPVITKYTYIFNLPVFIFLSGYLFNLSKFKDFWQFIRLRAKAIMIPYVGLSIISIVFYKFYYNMPIYDYTTMVNMIVAFIKATRTQIFYNIPLWFLPTLFFIEIAFYLIRKINNKYLEWIIVIILSSYFVIKWDTLYNPKLFWTIDTGCFYLLFFALGYYLRQNILNIKFKNRWFINIIFYITLAINLMIIYNNNLFERIFKNTIVINNGILYYLTLVILALSGIYITIKISQEIKRQKILEYIGRNSITFFGLHVLIFWILDKIIKPIYFIQQNQIILSTIYVLITTVCIIALIPKLKQYLPLVFGKC